MKKWSGVFPASTTQFRRDESLDVDATQKVVTALIDDGVDGLICIGTVGENYSLAPEEKRAVLAAVPRWWAAACRCSPASPRTRRRARPISRATPRRSASTA